MAYYRIEKRHFRVKKYFLIRRGVKSLYRYLNQYQAADEKVKKIAKETIAAEETLIKDMREYL